MKLNGTQTSLAKVKDFMSENKERIVHVTTNPYNPHVMRIMLKDEYSDTWIESLTAHTEHILFAFAKEIGIERNHGRYW